MKKTSKDSLGDRMKRYEAVSKSTLVSRMPVILRLDGCHFHTFAKKFQKPFDKVLMETMQVTMAHLCQLIQGCVFGYTQSDEITLVLVDYKKLNSSAWFDNEVQKMCSVAAAMATLEFNKVMPLIFINWVNEYLDNNGHNTDDPEFKRLKKIYHDAMDLGAYFDCRAFNVPKEDVCNCILWRQQDATRNSIQMLAQANFSHKSLQNLNCNQLQEKLFTEKGINWNDLDTPKKRGSAFFKDLVKTVNDNGEEVEELDWKLDVDMPILTQDRKYVERHIYFEE